MVGGNGPNVTWRLAARHADELNLDGLTPDEVAEALPVIRVALRGDRPRPGHADDLGPRLARDDRRDRQRRASTSWPPIAKLGVSRVMGLVRESVRSDEALGSLVEDARAAGLEFD